MRVEVALPWALGNRARHSSKPTHSSPPTKFGFATPLPLTHTTTFSSTSSYSPPNTTATAIMSDFNAIARKLQRALDCSRLMLISSLQSSSPSTTTRLLTRTAPSLRLSTCVDQQTIQRVGQETRRLTTAYSATTPCSPLSSRLSSVPPTSSTSSRYGRTVQKPPHQDCEKQE